MFVTRLEERDSHSEECHVDRTPIRSWTTMNVTKQNFLFFFFFYFSFFLLSLPHSLTPIMTFTLESGGHASRRGNSSNVFPYKTPIKWCLFTLKASFISSFIKLYPEMWPMVEHTIYGGICFSRFFITTFLVCKTLVQGFFNREESLKRGKICLNSTRAQSQIFPFFEKKVIEKKR